MQFVFAHEVFNQQINIKQAQLALGAAIAHPQVQAPGGFVV
jgi:hypothetical protein